MWRIALILVILFIFGAARAEAEPVRGA